MENTAFNLIINVVIENHLIQRGKIRIEKAEKVK